MIIRTKSTIRAKWLIKNSLNSKLMSADTELKAIIGRENNNRCLMNAFMTEKRNIIKKMMKKKRLKEWNGNSNNN